MAETKEASDIKETKVSESVSKYITVIGSLNVDYTTRTSRMPQPGETFRAISFQRGFGGKGANQAVACARLSAPTQDQQRTVHVRMCGYIGGDGAGKEMKDYLAKSDIDVSLVQEAKDVTTGSASITVVDETGENCILIVGGANDCMTGDEEITAVDNAYHLAVFQLETPIESVEKHVEKLRAKGAHILLNPSPAPEPGQNERLAVLNGILPNVEYLVVNLGELELLNSITPGTLGKWLSRGLQVCMPHLDKTCNNLLHRGVSNVIVTLGSLGIYIKSKQGKTCSQGVFFSALKAKVVDTTGAGDTFLGAFAASITASATQKSSIGDDKALIDAILFARHAAAMSVEKPGAQTSVPTHAEVSADQKTNKFRGYDSKPLVGREFAPLTVFSTHLKP